MLLRIVLVATMFLYASYGYTQAEIIEETQESAVVKNDNLLETFCSFLKGEFSSSIQAAKDTNYLDVSLVIFPIWEKEVDAKYFYVEQAVKGKETKPYRQRVYKVYQTGPSTIVSSIFTLKNQENYIQLHASIKKQKELSIKELELKEGCDVFLEYDNSRFYGGTVGKKCVSTINGSKYATLEIELYENKLISWERGFFGNGVHAWGATAGGYIFDKIR